MLWWLFLNMFWLWNGIIRASPSQSIIPRWRRENRILEKIMRFLDISRCTCASILGRDEIPTPTALLLGPAIQPSNGQHYKWTNRKWKNPRWPSLSRKCVYLSLHTWLRRGGHAPCRFLSTYPFPSAPWKGVKYNGFVRPFFLFVEPSPSRAPTRVGRFSRSMRHMTSFQC